MTDTINITWVEAPENSIYDVRYVLNNTDEDASPNPSGKGSNRCSAQKIETTSAKHPICASKELSRLVIGQCDPKRSQNNS